MKSIANRLIVFAVSAMALGTAAYGQTRMTAEIPFAFRTVTGTMPAGNYDIVRLAGGQTPSVVLRDRATQKSVFTGNAQVNAWKTADKARVEFVCSADDCSLKAIRTSTGSLEYAAPHKSKKDAERLAVVSIPLKTVAD